jgi:hypothetical protein
MGPADHRITAARAYLDEVSQRGPEGLRPSEMITQVTELRHHLGAVLAAIGGQPDGEPQEAAP